MYYPRALIVLTLLSSMIGLALPSDPQRKMAKGSKKNPSSSSQQEETVIPVEVMVPQTMRVGDLQERVTKIVFDILKDNKRRALAPKSTNPFSVATTNTTETESAPIYSKAAVACYAANVSISSDRSLRDVISKLKDLLDNFVDENKIVVTSNKKGYAPVKITNKTPYEAYSGFVDYDTWWCRDDVFNVASGQTWTATSRGFCKVSDITANLVLSPSGGDQLECKMKTFYGASTRLSQFYIVMDGDDKCCVLDSVDYGTSPKRCEGYDR